jgi:hypothetical protein
VAEAIRKTEIALQLPVMNTVHFDINGSFHTSKTPSTAILLSDSVAIPIRQLYIFFCFMLCTTRDSPVGISRDIYRICFYMNVSMYAIYTIVSFPFKMYPGTEKRLRLVT